MRYMNEHPSDLVKRLMEIMERSKARKLALQKKHDSKRMTKKSSRNTASTVDPKAIERR